ncbi:hypothetical protein [Clostridium scatologenes]|uniref:Uncharacterized protein n=1 Tax=Clostridium scatologenes TaxID=1548 RepID=A0A0E3JY40_CLOSL|nr:hypothetical protein [Clostridium scatologenes]AKA68568.1 hypothetical protein CSCA_1443 [Clostridium scatologenes]
MLNIETMQLLVIGGVVGAVIGFLGGIPFLKKKGVNIAQGIDTASNIVKAADPAINIASSLLPNNKAIGILKTIEKWATIAVGQAQQLYYAESIGRDERISTAQNVVYNALLELNIPLDTNKKNLINAAIENAVKDLGHNKTEDEQIAEKQALQAKVIQLTTENTNLKNTISQVNAVTVQTTQNNTANVAQDITNNAVTQ